MSNKEVNLDAFADKIASKLLAARQQANEAGEEVGEEFVEGVVKGIKEHSKDAKSEVAKLFEEFNKVTNNFKTRKSINNSDWNRVLGMSKELMKSERYADAVLDKLSDISVTFKNIGKTSGIANVLKELEKGATIESVAWSEASKNYKPKKKPVSRPNAKSVDVASAFTQLSNLSEDPYLIKEEEKINNIYQKRLAIIKKIGEAKLKEHDVDAYEAEMNINSEYQSRLDGFKEQRDNDIYDKLGDQLGYYNDRLKSSLELEELLAERRKTMKDVHFKGDDSYKYEVKVNKELEKRIELMKSLEGLYKNGLISKDDMESMMYERGTIDERRSALEGVFQDVFNRYDKDASRQDNLDDAQFILEQLGFSKIGITTGGGKKIEIGPEMSMADYETFMKMNIESARSIEFVRKETQMTIGVMEDQAKAVEKVAEAQTKLNKEQNEPDVANKQTDDVVQGKSGKESDIQTTVQNYKELKTVLEECERLAGQMEKHNTPEIINTVESMSFKPLDTNYLIDEEKYVSIITEAWNEYKKLEGSVESTDEALIKAEKTVTSLAVSYARAHKELSAFNNEELETFTKSKYSEYQRAKQQEDIEWGLHGTKTKANNELFGGMKVIRSQLLYNSVGSKLFSDEIHDQLLDAINKIILHGGKANDVLDLMANLMGLTADKSDEAAKAIQRTADEQKRLDELGKVKSNQESWLRYLDNALDKNKFQSSGKRDATNKLKSATGYLLDLRNHNYENASGQYAKEMAEVAWMHAYQEAEKQGVAKSVLTKYDVGYKWQYEENLKTLQKEREYRQKSLDNAQKEIDLINQKTEAQREFNNEKKNEDMLYHAGDLSNISGTLKSFPLGNVPPTRSNGIGGLTGLYTTDELDGFIGNEWQGAPISTIDPSAYKLLNVRSNEVADKVGEFLNDINATIYGYYNAIDEKDWSLQRHTDVKSIDELYAAHQELFAESGLSLEQFTQFINNAKEKIAGKSFADIELPAIDEGVAKSGISSAMQDVTEELFNSDSFQTQFLKMLGYEGVNLRGTKYNGTYTGGSVIFDVKPESIKATNEKWSDVMARNGYEVTEDDLKYEEKRRQLAFETAKAYSKQAEAAKEVKSDALKDTFDVIQQGESVTGKFVTTANTVQEALQNMRAALPEEQKEWGAYIDQLLKMYDNKHSMKDKLAEIGSMGDASEQYRIENLGDGKMAVTFSGIKGQIEGATAAIEEQIDAEKDLLSIEQKISAEREAQFEAYSYAATNLLSAGYESIPSDIQAKLFTDFADKIVQDGMSASDAMDQLYISLEALKNQSKEMPEDVIENFGAESEKVAETVTQLKKLSSIDLTRIFDSVDLKSFLEAFNIDKSSFTTFRTLFEELMQITNAMANGVDVGNAFDLKMEEITSSIMKLGGYMVDLDDGSYATMMQDFYKHMSNTKVQFNDTIKADYTKDQWKSLYGTYKNRLTADLTKGIPADSLYQELSGLFPSLFPEGVLSQQDQFKLIFDKLDEARQLQANNWKTLHGFVSSDRDAIQLGVDDMYNHMSDALFAGSSADAMTSEADAAKDVVQSMNSAADAKGKFANANKKVGDSANASADQLADEADAMEKVATSAEDLPDGDVVTKLFIGENEDPSGAIIKQMRMVGDKMQTEAKRLAANEEGGWDVAGSTVTEQKLRGMQEYIKAYRQEANKLNGIQANIRALGDDGMSADLTNKVKSYTVALEKMNIAMKELRANPNDPAASMKFDDAARDANKARAEIEGIFKESQKLSKIGQLKIVGEKDVSKVENLKSAMIEFANSTWDGEAKITGFNKKGTEMYVTLNQGAGAVENITVALDKASGHLQAFTTGTSKATNEWEDFKTQAIAGAKNIAGMYVGFQEGVQAVRKGVEYVKEIDLAMTELKKVTDETDASYKQFLKDAGSTSAVIGSTISDFTEATATFARLGYSMEESSSMAETAIIYKNVADGLDSVEESSDSIISTMMAFGIEANDTMSIIDRFNAVGNNFAITSAGIGEALQRSASALYSAGNTIDESVALVTAANSVIQNPEQVGTALKTLALRLRGAKIELEEAGLETDNMAESTSTLQAKLNALTHGKVDIMLDADTFKSTTQILREMSAAWEDMTDIERASALELMGGKRQANILSSVITNFETVEDVIKTSMESSGSAISENEKWLDSIEGKTYQFTNALQTMWSNMLDSEVIKGFLDFGTGAIQFLDTGAGKVIALVAALKLMAKFKGFSIKGITQGLTDTIQNITKAQQMLQALSSVSPVDGALPTESINAYAAAVSGLTAKQQANLLASQNLTKQDIQTILQTNKCTEAETREAMAHVQTKATKEQEAAASQQLLAAKTQEAIASYKSQAAKLMEAGATETDTVVSEANAAASFLEANASEGVTLAKVQEAVASGTITAATGQEIIAKLGLTGANKGLLASIQALYASNPAGWTMMIVSAVITLATTLIPLIKNIKSTEEKLKDLNQEWDTLSDKIHTVSNNFKELKSSTDEIIPRFAELAKGVDQFGNNISLTSEEYAEFWDLNNKIADMFPEINRGMDSNGNAMLSLSYTADTLTASLEAMVEAEKEAANQEIADTMPDVLENISDTVDAYKDQIGDLEKEKEKLQEVYNSIFNLEDETVTVSSASQVDALNKKIKYLQDLGVKVTQEYVGTSGRDATFNLSYDFDIDEVTQNYENAMAGLGKEIEDINTKISNKWSDLNPVVTAYIETNFQYQNLNDDIQEVAKAMVGNLDFSELWAQGYDTEEEIQTYIRNYVLNPIQNLAPVAQNAFSKLLSIDTSDKSVQEYIDSIKSAAKTVADNSDFKYDEVLKNTGYDEVIEQYTKSAEQILDVLDDNIPKYYEKYDQGTKLHLVNFHKYGREVQELKDKIYSLSPDKITKSFDIIKKYGIKTWDDLAKALENKTFDLVLEYDAEQEGIQQLLTAIEESVSATGLSAESIENLKARYQDLEGYDPARLFEETTNGIHLNTEALRELEKAYEDQNKAGLDKKLEGLTEQYASLTDQIDECGDAYKRAELYSQRQNVLDQINDTATLAARYEGLTSAYNKWKNAQSSGNERDMYDSILSGKEEVEEELARGWLDESTRKYLELLSGKDLSTAKYDELLSVYEKLKENVNNSGYDVFDFFTEDKDGNSTTDGIFNFLDAVKVAQEEIGKEWVKIGESGEYIFDFGDGGDKAVAEALGISEELVQIILRAAKDAGFEVNMDSAYSQLADFKDEVQVVNDRLKELGATEYTFNINSTDIEDLDKQIVEAELALKNLKNEDGTLKVKVSEEDYQNAQTLLATLIYQKQTLDEAVILKVNVEDPDAGIETVVQKLQSFKSAYNELEVKAAIGADTTEAEQNVDAAIASLNAENKKILADLGIDLTKSNEEINAAINAITVEDLTVKCGLDTTLVDEYAASEHTSAGEVVWDNNITKVTEWANITKTSKGTVNWENNISKVKTFFNARGVINFSVGNFANGTAHSSGTAYAGGSWGAKKTETSLVGELGPEILVRNGKWTTVGEDGAEFTQVKKGDIIFNHKQTEELLKNGYVTGRGKAYASGTALSDGNGPGRTTVKVASSSFKDTSDSLSNAADDISDAADEFREVFDWIEVRLEEINKDISYRGAQLENQIGYKDQNKVVNDIIELNQRLYDNLIAGANKYYTYSEDLLKKVPDKYREAAQDGTISIETFVGEVSEKTLEAIKDYREWVQKGDDAAQQAEEVLTEISNLAKQAIDNIAADYDNKKSLSDIKMDQYEAYNELLETDKGFESASIYQQMINENNNNIPLLEEKRNKMQAELNKRVESGEIKVESQEWYDAVNDIAAVDTEIINLKTDTENYQDAINNLHWEQFDSLMNRLDLVSEEADNLIDILSNKDLVDESGNWTDEGITSLGLYAQKMEAAEVQAKKYQEEIDYLNENWQELGYTEEEYIEKLSDLKDGQYDAIQAYHDSKDAIVDLNKERVEAIKDGIQKEIDAYEELIEKKKEELDAEKDLYDFQKSIMEQEKDVADLKRQLAALSSDNSASARAKRAQLEAELAEAEASLQDSYYERSIQNQQDALDKELENFQEEKDKEMEGWDEYLDNTEQVVADSLATVQANTEAVYTTLQTMGQEYGLSITESLTSPWKEGSNAIQSFSEQFGISMSATVDELTALELQFKETMLEIEQAGNDAVNAVKENAQGYTDAEYKEPETPEDKPKDKDDKKKQEEKVIKVGGKINAKGAKIYDYAGDKSGSNQYYAKDPIYVVLDEKSGYLKVRHHKTKSGVTGWFKKSDVKAYAKGSTGVDEDQWALIDELGDELLVRAQNGRLTYLEKGSGVVPADLTENLMGWGRLDPSIMLDQNRPAVGVHPEIHNTQIQIDNSIAELIHIDHCDQNTLPDVKKIVDEALEKHTQKLNNSLRKYTR